MTKTTSQKILEATMRNGSFDKVSALKLFRGLTEREVHSNVMRVARELSYNGYLRNRDGRFTLTSRGRKSVG